MNITPRPNINTDEIRIPSASKQIKFRMGDSFPAARRATQVARRFFASKNLIRPTGNLLFKKLMTELE
ncbi:MAG: hypothetical protein RIR26_2375 [Pseudomonadota bacterium]